MEGQPTGETAPDISAPAFSTRLVPDRAWIAGRPLAVLFHGRENQDEARGVIQTIRNKWRDAETLVTVNLVDLSMFPRVMRKLVNYDLGKVFDAEAASLPGDLDQDSHIVIVPDFDGKMTKAWGRGRLGLEGLRPGARGRGRVRRHARARASPRPASRA
jgi:hypothetical protein